MVLRSILNAKTARFCFCETIFYEDQIQQERDDLMSFTSFTMSEASFEWCKTSQIIRFELNLISIKNSVSKKISCLRVEY